LLPPRDDEGISASCPAVGRRVLGDANFWVGVGSHDMYVCSEMRYLNWVFSHILHPTFYLTFNKLPWLFLCVCVLCVVCCSVAGPFCFPHRTGPAAQINLMGYAKTSQTAHGIHQRLRARAFIAASFSTISTTNVQADSSLSVTATTMRRGRERREEEKVTAGLPPEPTTAICFVSIDVGMGSDLLNMRVIERLEEHYSTNKNQTMLCHLENLSISGTHTHSAPAGFLQYTLFQITSLGFSEEVVGAYVEGIVQAILLAHENLQPGSIRVAQDVLMDANINRSPTSYLLNPEDERNEYSAEGDTDKTMVQLSFETADNGTIGLVNWFAVHGTSMNASNLLISGDNKGTR
jgi:neutral ceramidase